MIVAATKNPAGQPVIIVGLTEADSVEMRKGLTKVKEGNLEYGFSSLVTFNATVIQCSTRTATRRTSNHATSYLR